MQQARGAGLNCDHVDRVTGGVVQVAGDPGALLGGGEAPVALGIALVAQSALLELGELRAPQPRAFAGKPRDAPQQDRLQQHRRREFVAREPERTDVDREQPPHGEGHPQVHGLVASRLAASRYSAAVGPSGGPAA